jgi:ABC-type sugar transport system substrate-binding protein
MKKVLSVLLVVVLMVGVFSFVGCKSDKETPATSNETTDVQTTETEVEVAKTYKIGMIPKFTGVDYFIAVENGAKKAAADLGVDLDWQGDASGQESAAKQQAYIQTFIDKGYDAILVSALDASSYAETLKQARADGIKVITWDADVQEDARDFFVNQVENSSIGTAMMQGMAGDLDGKPGTVAVVSTDPNASNQNAWIAAIQEEYNSKKDTDYTGIEMHNEIIYAGNNQAEADSKLNTLLVQNSDITGVFALSSMAVPATTKAIVDLGLPMGSVAMSGLGIPVTAKKDMESGTIKSVILWQPYDLGYLAVEFALKVLQGEVQDTDTEFVSSLSGNTQVKDMMYEPSHLITPDKQVILGKPVVYTIDLVDYFKGYPNADSGLK